MVREITFGSFQSYTHLGLILASKIIGSPKVKQETVNVPGADGQLDFTEFFGEPKYSNRTLEFEFSMIGTNQLANYSNIKNKLHGQKMNIFLDEDPYFHYVGRIFVGDYESAKGIGTITISCDCEPWKYKNTETSVTIAGSGSVTLANLRKTVTPKITVTAETSLSWTGGTASLSPGTDLIVPELQLKVGNTIVNVVSEGTTTFKYLEGQL